MGRDARGVYLRDSYQVRGGASIFFIQVVRNMQPRRLTRTRRAKEPTGRLFSDRQASRSMSWPSALAFQHQPSARCWETTAPYRRTFSGSSSRWPRRSASTPSPARTAGARPRKAEHEHHTASRPAGSASEIPFTWASSPKYPPFPRWTYLRMPSVLFDACDSLLNPVKSGV